MTLRTKLLALFAILAAGPLLAIGVIGYLLSLSAVAAQLESQTRPISERVAEQISRGSALIESDLHLLAGNAETVRLLELTSKAQPVTSEWQDALVSARAFFSAGWDLFGTSYASIELRDAKGNVLLEVAQSGRTTIDVGGPRDTRRLIEYTLPAGDPDAHVLGSVRALVRLESLIDPEALDSRFGRYGVSVVLDRSAGRVLRLADERGTSVNGLAEAGFEDPTALAPGASGPLRVERRGSAQVGWVTSLDGPTFDVISLADVDEFAAPFRVQRNTLLGLVMLLALAVLPAGAVLLRRATRSLEELTSAADRVALGDFAPDLPPGGRDEVGRLARAFRVMVGEVSRMMSEIERSRQLAAVGSFAAELSHEIRNPLTAIKLNLQRIQRFVAEGEADGRAGRPTEIALREIGRLDRVVRGALKLGRSDADGEVRLHAVGDLIARALNTVRPQLEEAALHLHVEGCPGFLLGDDEQVTGALVNLLLNGIEATRSGGSLSVATAVQQDGPRAWVEIRISDSGSGIPEAARSRLFQPFFTTRRDGTGLGLALALRSVEAHGGSIQLVRSSPEGTEFLVRLPSAPASA
jgi:signal transduction histidine kinase